MTWPRALVRAGTTLHRSPSQRCDYTATAAYVAVGVGWLIVAGLVARDAAVRTRRWRRNIVVGRPRGGGPVYAQWCFPWPAVDSVTVRRVGVRRARTVLVGASADSDLYRTPGTADLFRPRLRAFAVCDLTASVMPADEVIVALRRHGGDRWRHS